MHNSKRIRRWFLLPAAAGMLMAALFCLTGCGLAERAVYGFSGEGVEHWENVAAENGITSKAEEYYYNNLPEGLHEIYREMYVHIMMNEDSGDIMSKVNADDFWKAYYAILADHPEIFWVGSSAQIKESGLTKEVVSYSFETTVPTEARASMKENL